MSDDDDDDGSVKGGEKEVDDAEMVKDIDKVNEVSQEERGRGRKEAGPGRFLSSLSHTIPPGTCVARLF